MTLLTTSKETGSAAQKRHRSLLPSSAHERVVAIFRQVQDGMSAKDCIITLRACVRAANVIIRECEAEVAAKEPIKPIKRSAATLERQEIKRSAAMVAKSVMDSVLLAGKPIGDVWYSELIAIRNSSIFEASLAERLSLPSCAQMWQLFICSAKDRQVD